MAKELFRSWSWRFLPRSIPQKRKKGNRKKRVTGRSRFLESKQAMKNLRMKSQRIPTNKSMWNQFARPRRCEQKRSKENSVVSWQSWRG